MQPNRRRSRHEPGQAIVLIALMAVTLVAFVGLALDAAQIFENRRWMQNGSDAGALAGAYGIGNGDSDAAIAAKIGAYAGANGAAGWSGVYLVDSSSTMTQPLVGSGVANPSATYNCVRVTSNVTFPTYFVGVLGFDSFSTSAPATACSGFVVQQYGPGIRPLAVATTTFDLYTEYCMFNGLPEHQLPPPDCTGAGVVGNFGWVLLGDGQTIQDQLLNGFQGTYDYWTGSTCATGPTENSAILPVPSCLELRTGDIASTRNELEYLRDHGIELVVPIWDYQCPSVPACNVPLSGSEGYIHIVAFAKFKVTSVVMTGNPKYIKGMFVGFVESNEICTLGTPGCVGNEVTKKGVQLFQ